ncbi:MAG TPA: hypothetical protein PLS62_04880 [Desulfobacteraceae bacterium]|nr:hypothetical protein [Desulfobacteraceae bacterium]
MRIPLHGVCGHGHDGNIFDLGVAFDDARGGQPIHSGKLNVHDDKVGPVVLKNLQTRFRVFRFKNMVMAETEQAPEELQIQRVVFDYENRLCFHDQASYFKPIR